MTILYAAIALSLLLLVSISQLDGLSPKLYVLYAAALSVIALLKPFGVGPDDANYLELAMQGCVGAACAAGWTTSRDFVWFLLVSLAPHGYEFLAIKTVATAALLVKLFVLYQLSSNKIYALCIYVFSFYFLHDLTQYRVSLALAFFLLAIYLAARAHRAASMSSMLASVGSHLQAAPALFLYLTPKALANRVVFLTLVTAPMLLLALGVYPRLDRLAAAYALVTGHDYQATSDVGKYVHLADVGDYLGFRNVSIISIVILATLWLLRIDATPGDTRSTRSRALLLSRGSIAMAFALYVVSASVLDVQNRLLEFFMVPIALLFGNAPHSRHNYLVLLMLCGALFVRYHLLSDFFT
jgi:hypothetical protein